MVDNKITIYKNDKWQITVLIKDESVWMTQEQVWELFLKDRSVISKHISNIYEEWELIKENTSLLDTANVQKMHIGYNKPTRYYNLDIIFAVWYRVKWSEKAIAFRNWATSILKEFSIRWFVMDDIRLENWATIHWKQDFEELLRRVREIRFSEKQVYEKIKDLYAMSSDYDPKSDITKKFFAKMQNKFIYAITWQTTAELIKERANSLKPWLWMQSSKKNIVTKSEATTGKNYLLETELRQLYLLCEQFFSFAELQVALEREIKMEDWVKNLDNILELNKLQILKNAWKVSKDDMENFVTEEIKKYQARWWSLDIYIDTIKESKKLFN